MSAGTETGRLAPLRDGPFNTPPPRWGPHDLRSKKLSRWVPLPAPGPGRQVPLCPAGERVDAELYPFAQRVGPVWLVAVNSATANLRPWDASGAVGPAQRDRLRDLLRQLPPGPRILVTHYPVCLADGRPEARWHGLRDLAATVRVAEDGGVGVWLHGHRHHPYFVAKPPGTPFPAVCAGSATQMGLESYGEYEIMG